MRGFLWFLPALLSCGAAFAQNSGIDRSFGDSGIASISDPQDASTRMAGFVSCAQSSGQLRMVAALDATQIGSVLVDADGNTASNLTRIPVTESAYLPDYAIGACMADGRIVIAREILSTGGDRQLQVLRLKNDGNLDPTFGLGGESVVDMDAFAPNLADIEMPLGLNLEADGGVLVSMALGTISVTDAGLVRLAANGSVRFARHYASFPNMPQGSQTTHTSAAGLTGGQVWMVGTASLAGVGTTVFRARLEGNSGMVVDAPIYGSGSETVYAGGGRMLADGNTMVLAARRTTDNLRYLPSMIVIRGDAISRLDLPEPFAIAGAQATALSFSPWTGAMGTVIPTGEGRFLFVDALARMPDATAPLAAYLALVQLGASAAGDQVDAHYGIAGRTQYAWRGMQVCNDGAPPPQRPVHATNWRGRPVVTGLHGRTCDLGSARGLLARVQYAADVFAHGFE